MAQKIVIVGSIALDRIMNFSNRYVDLIEPSKLDVLSISVLIDDMQEARGGVGANISYNMACLGEKPYLLGSAGTEAEYYLDSLKEAGVDVSMVNRSNMANATFTVITDADHNQIGGFYPGAMSDSSSVSFAPFKETSSDYIFCLSAHDPTAMNRQVDECKEFGLRLFYDPGQQVSSTPVEDLKKGIEIAEVVITNEYEQSLLLKRMGISLDELQQKVPILISTQGSKGSIISGNTLEAPISIGVAKPSIETDPTGAGDAYRAGFLYGYSRDWKLEDSAQLGAVLASFVLEKQGTQVNIIKELVSSRYKETFNKEVKL
jgi:adenosine kinase